MTAKSLRSDIAEARKVMRSYGITRLLADPASNPKVAKNGKVGVLTAPMHLAPADLSGYEVCPMATAGCRKACLHTAGNPAYMAGKQKSRVAKTRFYHENRAAFMLVLWAEINKHANKAHEANMICGVRLNATSDIQWERVRFTVDGLEYRNVMQAFPDVQFYDYTKIAKRFTRGALPDNYHLTFSLAEGNDGDAIQVLRAGGNVAAVFDTKRGHDLPKLMKPWLTLATHATVLTVRNGTVPGEQYQVIDGDEHDYRPADPAGVIVGLRAKGDARKDTSGFVRAA